MTDTVLSFCDAIRSWTDDSAEKLEAVFRGSVQDTVEIMQEVGPSAASTKAAIAKSKGFGPVSAAGRGGAMPVDTGYLRASLVVTAGAPASVETSSPDGGSYSYDPGKTAAAVQALELGGVVYATYTAAYARRLNYGFSGTDASGNAVSQRGYHFVDLAAQRWQQTVDANVVKVQQAFSGTRRGS